MKTPFLSVVIPAYNEAERLPATLVEIDRYLRTVDYAYEILVVSDGSSDNTAEVARNMAKAIKNLKVVEGKENRGKGGVVRQGMLLSRGEIRIFTDADNSTSLDQIKTFLPYFKEGYGVVIGSRAVRGAALEPAEPLFRQAVGKGLNLIVQALLLPGIWDTQCGFKAFTAEAAERIFTRARISGWGFDVEALSLAKALGCRIREAPIRWANDARSHIRMSAGLQFLRDVCKIRWWLWRGAYGGEEAASVVSAPPEAS